MIGLRMGLAAVLAAAAWTSSLAAEKPTRTEWVGTWGYVSAPLPPGVAPPAAAPPGPPAPVVLPATAAIPLGPPPAPPAPPAARPPAAAPQILIENPGNLPVQFATPDLANVTVRQIVRVSVGGRRLRLRLSNENGAAATETLVAGAPTPGTTAQYRVVAWNLAGQSVSNAFSVTTPAAVDGPGATGYYFNDRFWNGYGGGDPSRSVAAAPHRDALHTVDPAVGPLMPDAVARRFEELFTSPRPGAPVSPQE